MVRTGDTMYLLSVVILLIHSSWHLCEADEGDFCYDNSYCGPSNWPGSCNNYGMRQSPIYLPVMKSTDNSARTQVTLNNYRADAFRMRNTGSSVEFEFKDSSTATRKRQASNGTASALEKYTFFRGHFHWGATDMAGSEHCFEGPKCFSMELHLVHYLSSYPNINQAIASGNPDALSVIGVFLDAGLTNIAGTGSKVIAPIVRNLGQVGKPATHDDPKWYTVNSPLDLTPLLFDQSRVYTYPGSLTTPGCNEQVNWYVMQMAVRITPNDVRGFRKILDSQGKPLTRNNRPIQNTAGRTVTLGWVSST